MLIRIGAGSGPGTGYKGLQGSSVEHVAKEWLFRDSVRVSASWLRQ